MWSIILGFLGKLPWLQIAIGTAIVALCVYGVHLIRENQSLETQNQSLQSSILLQKQNYDQSMKAVVNQKNEAITLAQTVGQQLEAIKNAKNTDIANDVLSQSYGWLFSQPDPYSDKPNSSGTYKGYASTCRRVLRQSDVANYLVRQFSALEECRSKLSHIRELENAITKDK